ncbi:MAG: hypothetical protein ACKPKO_22830, partial [Candidatus Fonsibacter sp.]
MDAFSSMDLSIKESGLARRQRKPHKFKAIDLPDGDIVCPLKSEFDRVNYTLEGTKANGTSSALELHDPVDVSVQIVSPADHWVQVGKHWMRVHVVPRTRDYFPQLEEGGPDISLLTGQRMIFRSYVGGGTETVNDDYFSSLERE